MTTPAAHTCCGCAIPAQNALTLAAASPPVSAQGERAGLLARDPGPASRGVTMRAVTGSVSGFHRAWGYDPRSQTLYALVGDDAANSWLWAYRPVPAALLEVIAAEAAQGQALAALHAAAVDRGACEVARLPRDCGHCPHVALTAGAVTWCTRFGDQLLTMDPGDCTGYVHEVD